MNSTDFEVDYKAALLKRQKLEEEIYDCDASAALKSNMLHTLPKLWIAVQNMHDNATRPRTAHPQEKS